MAYTIRIEHTAAFFSWSAMEDYAAKLVARLAVEAHDSEPIGFEFKSEIKRNDRLNCIEVVIKPVRLLKPKLYCGQHPGECAVGPKRKGRWLEWDDWVRFNNVVNDVLDQVTQHTYEAEVWSTPHDNVGKFWIRKNNKRRQRYDWTEKYRGGFQHPIRVWNPGTEDQFEQPEAAE